MSTTRHNPDGWQDYGKRPKHQYALTFVDLVVGLCIVGFGAFIAGVASALIF